MEFIFLAKLNSPQIQEALILDVIKKQTPPSGTMHSFVPNEHIVNGYMISNGQHENRVSTSRYVLLFLSL